jgi:FkbM family methyltransferase
LRFGVDFDFSSDILKNRWAKKISSAKAKGFPTMLRGMKNLLKWALAMTPFEIRRRLPVITLEPLDLVLANYDARGQGITVLQVGACDGVYNDPIRHCVTRASTRAILIEPNPLAFARLKQTYEGLPNVTLVQAAIGNQDGDAYLYRAKSTGISGSEVDRTLQVASFSRAHLAYHGVKAHEIERITVPCRTLASLVGEFGLDKIDLLQIDAEGFDADVVRMALKMPILPDCINFEHLHLTKADRQTLFDTLKVSGYVLGYDDWNILALRETLLKG